MVIVRAPLRISFGGGGTDLAAYYERFGGFVLSAAIARYSYVVATEPADGRISINSADYRAWEVGPAGTLPAVEQPLALPKAALAMCAGPVIRARGIDLFLSAEAPPGSGLGSSSAMAAALVLALAAYEGHRPGAQEVAEGACRLEIECLEMPIGKQDQYASAFGGLNAIEFCREGVHVTSVDLPDGCAGTLCDRLLLFSTGLAHDSAAILRHQRADTGANDAVVASLHRIKALGQEMRAALERGNLDGFGELLDCAWQEKRRLSGRISSAQIDDWYGAARAAGAIGGKITGAGGGGFLLLYCPVKRQEALRAAMARAGLRELPFAFDTAGAAVVGDTRPRKG